MNVNFTKSTKSLQHFFDRRINIILILPAAIILLGLFIYPFFYNAFISFFDVSFANIRSGEFNFVGFDNYSSIFKDIFVQKSIIRTFRFALVSVTLQITIGLLMALAFNQNFRGKNIMMPLAMAPMMITPVAVGIFWRILLNSRWGVINYLLSLLGIPPENWLSDPNSAFSAIVMVQVWWGVPFVFLILLGGLSALPKEPYESAELEGANTFQIFRHITLPLLMPVIVAISTLRVIDALKEFDIIYMLTGGGPGTATRVFTLELFMAAFERGNYSLAAAQAMILLILILILTFGLVKALSKK